MVNMLGWDKICRRKILPAPHGTSLRCDAQYRRAQFSNGRCAPAGAITITAALIDAIKSIRLEQNAVRHTNT